MTNGPWTITITGSGPYHNAAGVGGVRREPGTTLDAREREREAMARETAPARRPLMDASERQAEAEAARAQGAPLPAEPALDANTMALDFVEALKAAGHTVSAGTFKNGGLEKLVAD